MAIQAISGVSVFGEQNVFIPSLNTNARVSIFIASGTSTIAPRWGWCRLYQVNAFGLSFYITQEAPIVGYGRSFTLFNPQNTYGNSATVAFDWKQAGVNYSIEYFDP